MAQALSNPEDILMSIKPSYAQMILEGSKTIELRRKFSGVANIGKKILIYATSPKKQIIGECYVKDVLHLPLDQLWSASCRDAMIDWKTFSNYFHNLDSGYGIVLHKQAMYENPIPLSSMRDIYNITPPQSYRSVGPTL